ncbi:MAG: hypothetical protein KatS3mg077_2987 [Candidatus Binatia bacterium]|nr:MAG: hypothetical protein KatS3mg077_2987 [Candidatus Binatia bacterium]
MDTGLAWNLTYQGELVFGPGCAIGPGAPDCAVLWHRNFFTGQDNDLADADELLAGFHGSWVSRIVHRIAPSAGLVGLKVLGEVTEGTPDRVQQALDWVIEHGPMFGVVAVNMSLAFVGQGGSRLRSEPCAEERELAERVRALGLQPRSSCANADGNGDTVVTVEEVIAAVNVRLYACPLGLVSVA